MESKQTITTSPQQRMNDIQTQKNKWISDSAYYLSLSQPTAHNPLQNWLEAEQQFEQQMKQRVKVGLTRIKHN